MTDYITARTAMVDCQVRPSDVTKYPIIDALLTIPREAYVPLDKRPVAYSGEHIQLGADRILLDARTFAKMLDALSVQSTEMVLDLGCGLGYSTAVLAKMAEAVVGVEEDPEMAKAASDTLTEHSVDNAYIATSELAVGNSKNGPYDVIILQGAVQEIPSALLEQLKDGGRICAVFIEGAIGECRIGYKSGQKISWRADFNATAPILKGFETKPEFKFA